MLIACGVAACVLCTHVSFAQEIDTLSSYRGASGYTYFRNVDVVLQAARFINPAPGYIREISLVLSGPSNNGKARLRLFGHEGGSPAPILENDLIDPLTLQKTKAGFERITLSLPERIFIENNQFFVAVDQLDSGVVFLSDRVEKQPFCLSKDDQFSSQVLKQRDGNWRWEKYSFAVDVIMEYPDIIPESPMGDVAVGLGILDTADVNRSIAWGDFNGDNYLDLLWNGSLYENYEGERFQRVNEDVGIAGKPAANLFLDVNNDGYLDILFLGFQDSEKSPSVLFIGDGSGNFSQIMLHLPPVINPTSFSLSDINADGFLDIFIGQSRKFGDSVSCPSYLWVNDQGKGFLDSSARLPSLAGDTLSFIYGSQFVDFNHDGFLDLYVSRRYPEKSLLLYNNGEGFFFTDTQHGLLGAGAGGDWKDYDNDGDVDLLYPRLIHSYLHKYRNERGSGIYTGDEVFRQEKAQLPKNGGYTSIAYEERHAGGAWGDVNNDGLLDAFFSTFGDCRFAELYTQNDDHTFSSATFQYGLHWSSAGEDGTWVDFDNDGWLDLCAIEWNRLRIYKNPGDGGHSDFIEIDAVNAKGGVEPGTSVTLYAGEKRITREVTLGRGILMGDAPRLHYGLGTHSRLDSAVVHWTDGTQEVFTDLTPNTIARLVKGSSGNLATATGASISAVPNPFSDQLHIYYSIPRTQPVRLEIYDQRGTLVNVLLDEEVMAGDHSAVWTALDVAGEKVPGGVYLYRLILPGGEVAGRAVLVR